MGETEPGSVFLLWRAEIRDSELPYSDMAKGSMGEMEVHPVFTFERTRMGEEEIG